MGLRTAQMANNMKAKVNVPVGEQDIILGKCYDSGFFKDVFNNIFTRTLLPNEEILNGRFFVNNEENNSLAVIDEAIGFEFEVVGSGIKSTNLTKNLGKRIAYGDAIDALFVNAGLEDTEKSKADQYVWKLMYRDFLAQYPELDVWDKEGKEDAYFLAELLDELIARKLPVRVWFTRNKGGFLKMWTNERNYHVLGLGEVGWEGGKEAATPAEAADSSKSEENYVKSLGI